MSGNPESTSKYFDAIPDELLLLVLSHLDKGVLSGIQPYEKVDFDFRSLYSDLCNASLVSRRFRLYAQEILYGHPVFVRPTTSRNFPRSSTVRYVRTLLDRPELRLHVKTLRVKPKGRQPHSVSDFREEFVIIGGFAVYECLKKAEVVLKAIGLKASTMEQWIANLLTGYEDAWFGLIIAMSPNLRTLFMDRLRGPFEYGHDLCLSRLSDMFCHPENAVDVVPHVRGMQWIRILYVESLDNIWNIPQLPKLHTLTLAEFPQSGSGMIPILATFRETIVGMVSESTPSVLPILATIRELWAGVELSEGNKWIDVSDILSQMPRLKTLRLGMWGTGAFATDHLDPQISRMNDMITMLKSLYATLETLELPTNIVIVDGKAQATSPVQSFQQFACLRSLIVSKVFLIDSRHRTSTYASSGSYGSSSPEYSFTAEDSSISEDSSPPEDGTALDDYTVPASSCLPSTLAYFEIHQVDEAVCTWLLDIFANRSSHFPHLKSLVLYLDCRVSRRAKYLSEITRLSVDAGIAVKIESIEV